MDQNYLLDTLQQEVVIYILIFMIIQLEVNVSSYDYLYKKQTIEKIKGIKEKRN